MILRRSVVSTAVLATALGGAVALAPSASASVEYGRICSEGPSGNVCAALDFERFSNRNTIKTRGGAESNGPVIIVTGAATVKFVNGVKSSTYADTSGGRTAITTGPHVNLFSGGFEEECDQVGRVVRYSGHITYSVNGKAYALDTPQWGGSC